MTSLIEALNGADMVEIDGLHAWQFTLDETPAEGAPALWIECMDGNTRRAWRLSLEQVKAAQYDPNDDHWLIPAGTTEHRLKCFAAICGDNLDADEDDAAND